jgi:hypothetical protein
MSEDNKFVGQPILSQILNCIPSATLRKVIRKHNSNHYYKKIPFRVHLVTLRLRWSPRTFVSAHQSHTCDAEAWSLTSRPNNYKTQ